MADVDPQAPSSQVRYQRVRGLWQTGTLSRASLFSGGDHLLMCDYRTGFTERYRRFYFSDIQAIIIRKTGHWLVGVAIWGFFAICLLVIALSTHWNLFLKIMEGICLCFVLRHLVRGPSCKTHVQTAVQTDVLPMLKRVRQTNRVLSRIFPLIEQAQGTMPAVSLAATPGTIASASETSSIPTAIPLVAHQQVAIAAPYPLSWLHILLFAVALLTGLNAIWEVNYPSSVSYGSLLSLFTVSVIGGIVGIVRQARHRVHFGTALVTWLLVMTFVIGMGGVEYVFTMIDAFTRARANPRSPPATFDLVSPFELRHMTGFDPVLWTFGVWAILLGLLGLIFVFLRPPLRIDQPPPLPGKISSS